MDSAGDHDPVKYFSELTQELSVVETLRADDPTKFEAISNLLSAEIHRVWDQISEKPKEEEQSQRRQVTVKEKIPMPEPPQTKDNKGRKYNFIGRILGPSGLSVKQLEAETGCEIVIRGKGSIRDEAKHWRLRGTPGWEHLDDPLHVVVKATANSAAEAREKLKVGVERVRQLLEPNHDEYKKRQLIQLAVINGTYRPMRKNS